MEFTVFTSKSEEFVDITSGLRFSVFSLQFSVFSFGSLVFGFQYSDFRKQFMPMA